MIVKIGQFRKSKDELIKSVRKQGIDSLSIFCACTGLPVVAACLFLKEEFPDSAEKMDKKIEALKEFYGYEEIREL